MHSYPWPKCFFIEMNKKERRQHRERKLKKIKKATIEETRKKNALNNYESHTTAIITNHQQLEPKLLFSKLKVDPITSDLSIPIHLRHSVDHRPPQHATLLPRDPKQALESFVRRQEHLASLSPNDVKEHLNKEDWAKAINRAKGIIVHDNESKLKRSLARKEAKKKTAEKRWNEWNKKTSMEHERRQIKRSENIEARKNKRPKYK